jgi:multidrug resistance efflux pump
MSKQISVTLSEQNIAWLDAHYNNRSGYIDDLLDKAREGNGGVDDAVREYQIQQLKSEVAGMEAELGTKKARLNTLQKQQESEQAEKERLLEEAHEALDGARLVPDNPAVENWAEKVDMTPEELINEVKE